MTIKNVKINNIYCADCLKFMKKIENETIDAIITDPPYGTNYGKIANDETLDVYKKSFKEMFRILKDKSFLVTYCFPLYVPEIIEEAKKQGFIYRWIGFNYYPDMFKQKPQPLGLNRHDLFLIFSRGEAKKRGYIKDTIHILMNKKIEKWENREFSHPHQKPPKCAEKIIKAISKENDLILDPFCGIGTFCVVAKRMNRNFIGIDISEEYCKTAERYLNSVKKGDMIDDEGKVIITY